MLVAWLLKVVAHVGSLLVVCLFVVRGLFVLFVMRFSLFVGGCVSLRCPLFVVRCLLSVACGLLFVVCCLLFVVWCCGVLVLGVY